MNARTPFLLARPAALALLLAAGCASQKDNGYVHGESYPGPDEKRSVHNLVDAQTANGAALDATLHPMHFDGESLNSLGQEKLDLMLAAEHTSFPMKVYLEIPSDDASLGARRQAVTMYLKDKGLNDEQIKVELGANLGCSSPAAESVRELRVLQSGDSSGGVGQAAPVGATPGAGH